MICFSFLVLTNVPIEFYRMTDDLPSKKEASWQKFADLLASNFQKHAADTDGKVSNITTSDGDVWDAQLTFLH